MSRRTTMTALVCHVERKYNVLYFTENPPNAGIDDDLFGYRYFLLFKNTFGIFIQLHSQLKAFTVCSEADYTLTERLDY